MAGIIGSLGNAAVIGKLIMWFFLFLCLGLAIAAVIITFLVKKTSKRVYEIDMQSKQLKTFNGRLKKVSKGGSQFWAGRVKRFLPNFQGKDIYMKGKQESVILLKDNNGMYHTARIPTWSEIKKWYSVVHGIDITTNPRFLQLRNVFLLPNPHEDIDWVAQQAIQADKEFKIEHWWQSPTVAYIGVGFVCLMMMIMTMILSKKL